MDVPSNYQEASFPIVGKSHKKTSNRKESRVPSPRTDVDGEESDDEPKMGSLSLKKKGIGSKARAKRIGKADADMRLLDHDEQIGQLQKQKKRGHQGREEADRMIWQDK